MAHDTPVSVPGYPKRAVTIEQDGARLSHQNPIHVSDDFSSRLMLEVILSELKKINIHLESVTGLSLVDDEDSLL